MALQSAAPQAKSPPPRPEPGKGRAEKKPAAAPASIQDIIDSVLPSQDLSPANFWRLCERWPAKDSSSVYVYRLWPVIDRRKAGQRYKYIDVWGPEHKPPPSRDKLLKLHGSGQYMLKFTDKNRPRTAQEVAVMFLTLEETAYPAVINIEELVLEHPDNRSFVQSLKAQGLIERDDMDNTASTAIAELAETSREDRRALLDMASRLAERPASEEREANVIAKTAQAMKSVWEMLGTKTGDSDVVLKMLNSQVGLLAVKAFLERPSASSSLSELDNVLKLVDRLRDYGGGGNPADTRPGWIQFCDSKAGEILARWAVTSPAAGQLLRAVASGALPGLTGTLPAQSGVGGPTATGAPAAPPPAAAPGAAQQSPEAAMLQKFRALLPRLHEALRDPDTDGEDVAVAMRLWDPELYASLIATGQAGIVELLRQMPDVWPAIEPHRERLDQLLGEFFEYATAEPEPSGEGPKIQ